MPVGVCDGQEEACCLGLRLDSDLTLSRSEEKPQTWEEGGEGIRWRDGTRKEGRFGQGGKRQGVGGGAQHGGAGGGGKEEGTGG